MFGLLTPCGCAFDDELRTQWQAHLCGLCLALRDHHGQTARLATNTDAVMISVLTQAQRATPAHTATAGPCPLRGMRRAQVLDADESGVRLAGTTSLTLAAAKAADITAEQRLGLAPRAPWRARAAYVAAGRLTRSADRSARLDVDAILAILAQQATIEHSGGDLDTLTAPTASAASAVFAATADAAGVPANAAALAEIGYDFGTIAHVLDAVDDYDDDAARGAYNPLRATGTDRHTALSRARRCAQAITRRYDDLHLVDDRLLRVLLLGGLRHAIDHRARTHATDRHMTTIDNPPPPPFAPNRPLRRRILPFLGVSCSGQACCSDHWNHCTDKYKKPCCSSDRCCNECCDCGSDCCCDGCCDNCCD